LLAATTPSPFTRGLRACAVAIVGIGSTFGYSLQEEEEELLHTTKDSKQKFENCIQQFKKLEDLDGTHKEDTMIEVQTKYQFAKEQLTTATPTK
jgi:hypothetical protein